MTSSHRVTKRQGFFSRLKGAIAGVFFGFIMIIVAFPLLYWNEGRAVLTARSLDEGLGIVQTVDPSSVDPSLEGKLIHITGEATTDETLRDETFGIVAPNAIRLRRVVEMYQWQETKTRERSQTRTGGSRETTYRYDYNRVWSTSVINSQSFEVPQSPPNPSSMPYQSRTVEARDVRVGAFRLNAGQIGNIGGARDLPVDQPRNNYQISAGKYYRGTDPNNPQIGDVRIGFTVVRPSTVSIVAKQTGETMAPFQTSTPGYDVNLFSMGNVSADEMFADAMHRNVLMTWGIRLGGFFLMFFGFLTLFGPLQVMSDIIPLFGRIVGAGLSLIAFALAAPLSLVTIAIGWIRYRPLFGGLLLIGAGAIFFAIVSAIRSRQSAAPAQPNHVAGSQGSAPPPIPS